MTKTTDKPSPSSYSMALDFTSNLFASLGKSAHSLGGSIQAMDIPSLLFSSSRSEKKTGNQQIVHSGKHEITITQTAEEEGPSYYQTIADFISNLSVQIAATSIQTIALTTQTVHEFFHPIEARIHDAIPMVHQLSHSAANELQFPDKDRLEELQKLELQILSSRKIQELYTKLGLSSRFFVIAGNLLLREPYIPNLQDRFKQGVNTINWYDEKILQGLERARALNFLAINGEIKRLQDFLKREETKKTILEQIADFRTNLITHPNSIEELRVNHKTLSKIALLETHLLKHPRNIEETQLSETDSQSSAYANSSSVNTLPSSSTSSPGVVLESDLMRDEAIQWEQSTRTDLLPTTEQSHHLIRPTLTPSPLSSSPTELLEKASNATNPAYSNPVTESFFTNTEEPDRSQDQYDPDKVSHSVHAMATTLATLQMINKELQGFIFVLGGFALILTLQTSLVAMKALSKTSP